MAYYIYDVLIAAILLFFFLRGRRKGLILTLFSLLGIFVAFFGARAITNAAAPAVADLLQPRFAAVIERRLEQRAAGSEAASSTQEGGAISSILDSLGLPDKLGGGDLVGAASDQLAKTMGKSADTLSRAAADAVAKALVFCVGFLTILALWALLGRVLDLAARLPGLHTLNRVLGGLFGLIQGMLILFLAAWVLRLFGGVIPQETVDRTVLLRFFCAADPIRLLSGI